MRAGFVGLGDMGQGMAQNLVRKGFQITVRDVAQKATIGVDVGGTFTDVVISDGVSVWRAKTPTTPGNLGEGVLEACRLAAEKAGTTLERLLPTGRWSPVLMFWSRPGVSGHQQGGGE